MSIDPSLVKVICFDIDGTLSDTDDQMIASLENRFRFLLRIFSHYKVHKLFRRLVMGFEAPVSVVYGLLDWLGFKRLLAFIMSRIGGRGYRRKKGFLLISGAKGMLAELSARYPLAIISTRDAASSTEFLQQFHLEKYFKAVITSQTCRHTKPFPDPLLFAAQQLKVSPRACLMVGDTAIDIKTGQRAGAQTVGVLSGFGTRRELTRAGADAILHSLTDLKELLI
jgi:phosphoglycolate phosphatase-like HAD superfamily hydrolase